MKQSKTTVTSSKLKISENTRTRPENNMSSCLPICNGAGHAVSVNKDQASNRKLDIFLFGVQNQYAKSKRLFIAVERPCLFWSGIPPSSKSNREVESVLK